MNATIKMSLSLSALLLAATLFEAGATAGERGEAIFAGGCFWCLEEAYQGEAGVKEVISGYTGGAMKHPTFDQVAAGNTGHAESVRVVYDPKKTSYKKLLDVFWHNIDPFTASGQFCDRGSEYRSSIFYLDDTQKQEAEASKRAVEQQLKKPVMTEVVRGGAFWQAEDYHQDFYLKNAERYHSYRATCGRDRRLYEVWGDQAPKAH
jgi:peptide-methionine (S)-S-oxide reductase